MVGLWSKLLLVLLHLPQDKLLALIRTGNCSVSPESSWTLCCFTCLGSVPTLASAWDRFPLGSSAWERRPTAWERFPQMFERQAQEADGGVNRRRCLIVSCEHSVFLSSFGSTRRAPVQRSLVVVVALYPQRCWKTKRRSTSSLLCEVPQLLAW